MLGQAIAETKCDNPDWKACGQFADCRNCHGTGFRYPWLWEKCGYVHHGYHVHVLSSFTGICEQCGIHRPKEWQCEGACTHCESGYVLNVTLEGLQKAALFEGIEVRFHPNGERPEKPSVELRRDDNQWIAPGDLEGFVSALEQALGVREKVV